MRKNYFLFLLLGFTCANAQIQSQDFEGAVLPSGWTTNIVSGNVDWQFGSGAMSSGLDFSSNAAIFDDDLAGEDELDNTVELISPPVDITSYATVSLSFEYAIQDYIGAGDFYAHVWDGNAWVEILAMSVDQNPIVVTYDVTAYKNTAFKVKFTFDDGDDYGWGAGVDNFLLTGTLGVKDNNFSKLKIYPNPTVQFLTIKTDSQISDIEIFNIMGQRFHNFRAENSKIDVSRLNSGDYFINFVLYGKRYSERFIKK